MIINSEGKIVGETASFDDVLLQPKYSEIESRSQIDISNYLDEYTYLRLPVISSPMDTVTETNMATAISSSGGLGVIHRYNTIEEQVELAKSVKGHVAVAIGVTGDYEERADSLVKAGCRILCLDVAHGHHLLVRKALKKLRKKFGNKVHLMAGNVATLEAFNDLADWGADSIRVGIGGGCFTAGTLVNTANGLKPIEQIEVGEEVYTHTGCLQKVTDTLVFDRDENITVINGIESTNNHEYYVVNKEDADKVNDDNIHNYAHWVEAAHLDPQRHLLIEID